VQIIDVSEHKPPAASLLPSGVSSSRKSGKPIPLLCPKCSREMRIVALIDEREVIEKILRHLGLWEEGVRVHTGIDPPSETTVEPWLHDPFPDYDTEPVIMYAND
jgi:hypothetical protein